MDEEHLDYEDLVKQEESARAFAESRICSKCLGRMRFGVRESDGAYLAVCRLCGYEEEI